MIIGVVAPFMPNGGASTVAELIALEIAYRNKKVCLTHSLTKSNCLYNAFGIKVDKKVDKGMDASKIVEMFKSGATRPDDISILCKKVTETLDVFSLNDVKVKLEGRNIALEYVTQHFPHQYVVVDVDDHDLNSESNQIVFRNCDVVVVVLHQVDKDLLQFKNNVDRTMISIGTVPQVAVVNKYVELLGTVQETSSAAGFAQPFKWCTVHYNQYIGFASNFSKMVSLYDKIVAKDARVAELSGEMKALVSRLMKVKVAKQRAKVEASYVTQGR